MSDNQKYYYIKLKDNYFEKDNIKILESSENGYIYSLIILKMCLKASKYDGRLMMTPSIPYDPGKVATLANVINHDIAHVKEAIRLGVELDIISIVDGHEIWMNEIQGMMGKSSTEADRIREYRSKIQPKQIVQMYDESTPELEREIKTELKIKKEKKPKRDYSDSFNNFWSLYPKKVSKGQAEKTYVAMMKRGVGADSILSCLQNYLDEIRKTGKEYQFIKNPSTFLNNYLDYENPVPVADRGGPLRVHTQTAMLDLEE